jgi:hypothetical protein
VSRPRDDYEQTVRRLLRLLEEKNVDAWIDLWADDGVNHYPYHSGLFTPREAVFEGWRGVPDRFAD